MNTKNKAPNGKRWTLLSRLYARTRRMRATWL